MSIVRYRKGNSVYLYESKAEWDPEKKQSRPKRIYLGMEDPVTGELIPSSRKAGRKPRAAAAEDGNEEHKDYRSLYENCEKAFNEQLAGKDADILALREEIQELKRRERRYKETLQSLRSQLLNLADRLCEQAET